MKLTTAALLPLLWLALSAHAEVQERLQEQYYDLQVASGESLSRTINQASPIRQNGQIYHAYTSWQVQWNF
ncbi:MAG: hypothetical protein DI559_19385, partial [Ectopseudomonas oleovorans]